MKQIRAYGGSALLFNVGGGWEWQARSKFRTYDPPMQSYFTTPKGSVYLFGAGSKGFGHCKTMALARKCAVNLLKKAAIDGQERKPNETL